MPDTALRRTIRRCTAVLVLVIALGFEELAEYSFDAALLFVVPAALYLVVSVLVEGLLRFEGLADPDDEAGESTRADASDRAGEGDA